MATETDLTESNPQLLLEHSESLRRRQFKIRLHPGNHYTVCYAIHNVHIDRNWLTDAEYVKYDGKYVFVLPNGSIRRLAAGSIIDIYMLSLHERTIEYRTALLERARLRRERRIVVEKEATV